MADVREVSRNDLDHAFREALDALSFDSRKDVLEWLPEALTSVPARAPVADVRQLARDITNPENWYAVHDSEIDLLKESVAVVLAALGGKGLGAIGSLVVLLFKYRKRRIRLQADQGIVLRELKRVGELGSSVESLAARLPDMPLAVLEGTLQQLTSINRTDGTSTALAACKGGHWVALDV